MKKEELLDMFQIAERADNMGIMFLDRISLKMDLDIAHQAFNLRLKDLLNADDFNFTHDIVGIQKHIDRENKRMVDGFLPRYSSL
ncbi:TPA: hypothetical protein ACOBID_001770 [Enterococcus faecium]